MPSLYLRGRAASILAVAVTVAVVSSSTATAGRPATSVRAAAQPVATGLADLDSVLSFGDNCADTYVLGARGSGEAPGSSSVRTDYTRANARGAGNPGGDTLSRVELPEAETSRPVLSAGGVVYEALPTSSAPRPYLKSIDEGIEALTKSVRQIMRAECNRDDPGQRRTEIVLVGYSQGALVVRGAVRALRGAGVYDNIAAVVLYGDPAYDSRECAPRGGCAARWNRPTSGRRTGVLWTTGISELLARYRWPLPDEIIAKTSSYCLTVGRLTDGLCDAPRGLSPHPLGVALSLAVWRKAVDKAHSSYVTKEVSKLGARWISERITSGTRAPRIAVTGSPALETPHEVTLSDGQAVDLRLHGTSGTGEPSMAFPGVDAFTGTTAADRLTDIGLTLSIDGPTATITGTVDNPGRSEVDVTARATDRHGRRSYQDLTFVPGEAVEQPPTEGDPAPITAWREWYLEQYLWPEYSPADVHPDRPIEALSPLPPGLVLTETGVVHGKPETLGTWTVRLRMTHAREDTALYRTVTIDVVDAPAQQIETPPGATVIARSLAVESRQYGRAALEAVPSPDGRYLALLYGAGNLLIRDQRTGDEQRITDGHDSSGLAHRFLGGRDAILAWSPDSTALAFASNDVVPDPSSQQQGNSNIAVWQVGDPRATAITRFGQNAHDYRSASAPVWSPDGTRLAYVTDAGQWDTHVWDPATDETLTAPCVAANAEYDPHGCAYQHTYLNSDGVYAGVWAADSSSLLLTHLSAAPDDNRRSDSSLLSWTPSRQSVSSIVGPRAYEAFNSSFDDQGDLIWYGDRNLGLRGVEAAPPHRGVHELARHRVGASAGESVSPDGRHLIARGASSSDEAVFRTADGPGASPIRSLPGFFHGWDGSRAVSASWDETPRWRSALHWTDPTTGTVRTLPTASSSVSRVVPGRGVYLFSSEYLEADDAEDGRARMVGQLTFLPTPP